MRTLLQSLSNGIELTRLLRPENYLVFLPILAITSALANAGPTDLELVVIWLIANLISFAVLFLALSLTSEALRRQNQEPILKLLGILIFGTAIGLTKSFLTFLCFWLITGLESFTWVFTRTLQNLPLGFTVIGIVALMLVAKDNYLAQRELLISHKISNLNSQSDQGSAAARLRRSLVQGAAREIAKVRRKLAKPGNLDELNAQAKELRSLAELTLRPLSHRIWAEQSLGLNDFSLRQLARLGLSERPFVPPLYLLLIIPGLARWAIEQYGLQQAAPMLLQVGAMLLVLQYGSNWFKTKGAIAGVARLVSVTTLSAAISAVLLYPGETFATEPQLLAMLASLSIWFFATSLMVSILSAGLRARADLRSELEAIYGKSQLEKIVEGSVSRYESRKVAQALHSDVQNRLISAALQLEKGELNTKEQLAAELSAIEAVVLQLDEDAPALATSAEAEILQATKQWRGFLEIELQLPEQISKWDAIAKDLGQVVSEALSNAKRHGNATKVTINVSDHGEHLKLEIQDNGRTTVSPTPGLGFALFRSVSQGQFDFQANSTSSVLTLEVPKPISLAIGS